MYNFVKEMYKKPKTIIPAITITNWAGFANQPDGNGLEIISNSASDTGLCTIWGTNKLTGKLEAETVTLTGVTAVNTAMLQWDDVIAVFLGDQSGGNIKAAVGTITVREASANQTVITLTANAIHAGMLIIDARGHNVEIDNASGKIYWSTLSVASATNGYYDVGTASNRFKVGVKEYLSIISDGTGCTTSVVVYED